MSDQTWTQADRPIVGTPINHPLLGQLFIEGRKIIEKRDGKTIVIDTLFEESELQALNKLAILAEEINKIFFSIKAYDVWDYLSLTIPFYLNLRDKQTTLQILKNIANRTRGCLEVLTNVEAIGNKTDVKIGDRAFIVSPDGTKVTSLAVTDYSVIPDGHKVFVNFEQVRRYISFRLIKDNPELVSKFESLLKGILTFLGEA